MANFQDQKFIQFPPISPISFPKIASCHLFFEANNFFSNKTVAKRKFFEVYLRRAPPCYACWCLTEEEGFHGPQCWGAFFLGGVEWATRLIPTNISACLFATMGTPFAHISLLLCFMVRTGRRRRLPLTRFAFTHFDAALGVQLYTVDTKTWEAQLVPLPRPRRRRLFCSL